MQVEMILMPRSFSNVVKAWSDMHTTYIKVFPDGIGEMIKLGFLIRSSIVMGWYELTQGLMNHRI